MGGTWPVSIFINEKNFVARNLYAHTMIIIVFAFSELKNQCGWLTSKTRCENTVSIFSKSKGWNLTGLEPLVSCSFVLLCGTYTLLVTSPTVSHDFRCL